MVASEVAGAFKNPADLAPEIQASSSTLFELRASTEGQDSFSVGFSSDQFAPEVWPPVGYENTPLRPLVDWHADPESVGFFFFKPSTVHPFGLKRCTMQEWFFEGNAYKISALMAWGINHGWNCKEDFSTWLEDHKNAKSQSHDGP